MRMPVEPLPDYGDHMTLDDFLQHCANGMFIDYDGHGCYATATAMTRKRVTPSDVYNHDLLEIREANIDRRFTHVVWFNK